MKPVGANDEIELPRRRLFKPCGHAFVILLQFNDRVAVNIGCGGLACVQE
jgi:hypothetical protein